MKKTIVELTDYYVPPFDSELFEAVRGRMVEIVIGIRRNKDEE